MILMSEFMILMSTHHHITMIYDYNSLYTKYPLYHHHIPLHTHLVGGLEYVLFSHILGIIIPTDFHIFQRGANHQPDIIYRVQDHATGGLALILTFTYK